MKELTWVIPNYLVDQGLLHYVEQAILSLKVTNLEAILLLIDCGSPIGGGYLREHADIYVRFRENPGFVLAANTGLRLAKTPYIGLMNNDIRLSPNAFEVARSIFFADDRVYSVHPRMIDYNEPFSYGDKDYYEGRERWCQSSCFFVRNTDTLILFPEHFVGTGGGYEDWYYHATVRKLGWKTVYTERACFQHAHSVTSRLLGEESKKLAPNSELFRREFGLLPEEYYIKLYPEQMARDWKKGFEL